MFTKALTSAVLVKPVANTSSLSLIFARMAKITGDNAFYDRWQMLLRSIAKLMSARSTEFAIFCNETKSLIVEMLPK